MLRKSFIFSVFFALTTLSLFAQEMFTIGLGYIKSVEKHPFYAPIIVYNSDFSTINLYEGEPIIEIDGQDTRIFEDLVGDSIAFIKKTAEIKEILSNCVACKFKTIHPAQGIKRTWQGYNGIFAYNSEFNRDYTKVVFDENMGYMGFSYKVKLKYETKSLYVPIVSEVKKGSPAELAGIQVGNEISKIEIDGKTEGLANIPLEWIIKKMKGKIGTNCVIYVNETEKKTIKRANVIGENIEDMQVVANCISGDCMNGYGVNTKGTEKYEGNFVNGKYQETGKIYKNGKLVFEGRFLDGKKHGTGVEYAANGNKIEAIYTNGKPGNNFKYTLPNGYTYYEVWQGQLKSYADANMKAITYEDVLAAQKAKTYTSDTKSTSVVTAKPSTSTSVVATPKPSTSTNVVTAKSSTSTSVATKPTSPTNPTPTSSSITKTSPSYTPKTNASTPTSTYKSTTSNSQVTTTSIPASKPSTSSTSASSSSSSKTTKPNVLSSKTLNENALKSELVAKDPGLSNTSTTSKAVDVHKHKTSSDLDYQYANPSINAKPVAETENCKHCSGKGLYAPYEKCTTCVHGHIRCKSCNGKGTYINVTTKKEEECTQCKYINDFMPHGQACDSCKGTGMIRAKSISCIFCAGTGKVKK